LDGNPAITLSYTFVYNPTPIKEIYRDVETSLGETISDKDKNDIEVYKQIKIITIKDCVGYIVTYTASKLFQVRV